MAGADGNARCVGAATTHAARWVVSALPRSDRDRWSVTLTCRCVAEVGDLLAVLILCVMDLHCVMSNCSWQLTFTVLPGSWAAVPGSKHREGITDA